MRTILHLCADIGSDSKPYLDAGYNVLRINKAIGVQNYFPEQEVYGIIANPVCTEFSIASGYHKKLDTRKGMFLVNECLRIIKSCNPVFWCLENPASGKLKMFLGAPTFVYEPWEYGSPWTKKTALWGRFNIPMKKYQTWDQVPKNDKLYVRLGRSKPSLAFMHKSAIKHIPEFRFFEVEDDMSFRSLCSQNFAKAFFEANR